MTSAQSAPVTGVYTIVNLASGLALDGGGSGTVGGTWVVQNAYTSTNQVWVVINEGGGTYELLGVGDGDNTNGGLALDDLHDADSNGSEIDVYYPGTFGTNNAQVWSITPTSGGYYTLTAPNDAPGYCIEPSGGSTAAGAEIVLYTCTSTSAEQWAFVPVSATAAPANGVYTIHNLASGLVLDGGGSGTTKGTWVVQDANTGGTNQQWDVTSLGNGSYEVIDLADGLSLDDYADATANGTEIDAYTINSSSGQGWYFTPTSGGYYTIASQDIVNAGGGFCIEPSGGSTSSGAEIVIYTCTNTSAEQWEFVPVNAIAATPVFSPVAGTYTSVETVTISDATSGATIYYTTNGTTPTTGSSVYSSPLPVSTSQTIEAVAIASGYSLSAVSSAAYTINLPAAATPTFSPAAGAYGPAQTVTISDATSGATIYYTTNGTTPTVSSSVYSSAITVSATETLEAIAIASGYSQSAVGSAAYTINGAVAMPTFSPAAGAYGPAQTVTISDTTSGATIYYTTNGTTPTTASSTYSSAITVSATETLEAIAAKTGYSNSAVGSAAYTINGAVATPTFSPAAGAYGPAQTVTISDTTSGATIYYTTNGTTPTTASSTYSSAITVSATETLEAIAAKTGYSNSAVGSAAYTINGAVATPTFSPAAGTYSSTQTVTISDSTSGATIYYTTNGTTPTTASSTYSSAITVSATETLEAIAAKTGYTNSAVASAAYTINGAVPTPTFSPVAGTYGPAQTVTISDSLSGSTIYYTTNGTTPTTASSVYSSAITVSATKTLEAIAAKTGYSNSAVGSAAYTINGAVATPTFSPAAGTYSSAQTVTITDSTSGATIYYTTNGTTPTTASSVYSSAITVSATETLEALATHSGYSNSAVGSAVYTLQVATPAFSPAAGTYASAQTVTISDSTSGATIYYTTNGTTPTTASSVYSSAITVSATETLKALATHSGYTNSAVASAAYTINGTVPTPTFSPAAGAYGPAQTVTISDSLSGSTIYYTTNGTTPTTASSVYSSAITVSATETLEAIAAKTGYTNSAVGSAAYTINGAAATPTFSPAAGTYSSAQTVTISDGTSGATIYYTTNGTTPTTASSTYSSAITVSATETLEAIAAKTGYSNSAVGSAAYTINGAVATPTFSPVAGTYGPAQTVTISDTTSGATIYYTTNGTTPTTASSTYSSAITVSTTETLEALAAKTGYSNSAVASAAYTINGAVATPTFSPVAGAYGPAQTVTISDSLSGSTIYYTTNGTTPTTASSVYSSAITVSATETLEALATHSGYSNSAVASADYTINGAAATPTFSPAAGTYSSAQTVTITDATSGATIYYTTNGTTPTTASSVYSSAITVSATETLEAIATASGYSQSAVGSAAYTISQPVVATPGFSPAAGAYSTAQTVTITDATSGATIYYTTNGTTPTTTSSVYSSAITVSATETVEALATHSGDTNSAVASAVYTIGTFGAPTNGYYTIQNLGSGLVLQGGGLGTPKGTWVLQEANNSGVQNSQVWGVSSLGGGTYQIINIGSGLSLDDYADGTGNGNEIDIYTNTASSGNTGQEWYLTAISGGYFSLASQDMVNAGNTTCIEPSGGSTASGAEIVVYACTDTNAEQWEFVPYTGAVAPANGTYEIQNLGSGLVMDGGGSGTTKGTWVVQDASTGGANQAWAVSGLGSLSGTYQIIGVGNGGLSLDDLADGTANGNEIDVYTNTASSGNTGQIWYLSPAGGGYYTLVSQDILNAGVNSCIEPTGGSTASGTDIVIYTCTPTSAEEWEFVPVSGLDAAPVTPTFSPAAGTYNGGTSVTIGSATPEATIYYTTNGATPTTSSAVYSAAINITASETLEALATAPGYTLQSAVASAAYTITYVANMPIFSPAEGTYDEAQTVTISDGTSGITIYYTTNGTTPTTSSEVYTGPITVSVTETVAAIAAGGGYSSSEVDYATYTIGNGSSGNCTGLSVGSSVAGTADMNGFVPFPVTNAWNVNIANAPVDPNNAMIQSTGGYSGENTHVNFGSSPGDGGIPFMIVDSSSTPSVPIYMPAGGRENDVVVAPYPNNVPIEGAAADCSGWPDTYQSDSHTNVLDRHTCWDYETYNTNRCNGLYDADGEVIWDMANGEMRPWGWTSTDAAGLSVMAGLLKYDEAASGSIKHAIRFTMQQTKNDANDGYFVEPATHAAGTYYGSPAVEGMRVRLKSSFNISGYSAINQAILTAFQQYGMIVADNGGYFYIQGATDSRWNDSDLENLAGISSSEFDVIQMSPAYPGWDSVTAPTGPAPTINSFTSSVTSVSSGSPVTFSYSVTGDSYDYIDMIGPVRLSDGSGSVTINPTATQTYMLYSVNQYGDNGDGEGYGVTVSTPITVTVPGSVVAPPTFTPVAGTFSAATAITLNTATYPYATIYYTTDGSTPTTSSTMYPQTPQPMSSQDVGNLIDLTVSTTETIKAIAVAPGYSSPSAVSSATYTIN